MNRMLWIFCLFGLAALTGCAQDLTDATARAAIETYLTEHETTPPPCVGAAKVGTCFTAPTELSIKSSRTRKARGPLPYIYQRYPYLEPLREKGYIRLEFFEEEVRLSGRITYTRYHYTLSLTDQARARAGLSLRPDTGTAAKADTGPGFSEHSNSVTSPKSSSKTSAETDPETTSANSLETCPNSRPTNHADEDPQPDANAGPHARMPASRRVTPYYLADETTTIRLPLYTGWQLDAVDGLSPMTDLLSREIYFMVRAHGHYQPTDIGADLGLAPVAITRTFTLRLQAARWTASTFR